MSNKDLHVYSMFIMAFVLLWRGALFAGMPRNLFEAYDVLILPFRPPQCRVQFGVTYEGAVSTKAFMDDEDMNGNKKCVPDCVNVLQIWQAEQDAIAALKGLPADTEIGQLGQELLRDDDNSTHGFFTPCADLHVPVNLPVQLRVRLPYQLTLGCYAAYREVELRNVVWRQKNPLETFDQITSPEDFICTLERLGHMSLRGWKQRGFGDLMTRVELYRTFTQNKPWLQMVGVSLRAGVLWPTGKAADPDRLLGLGLGNGGGVGMHASGLIELCYRRGFIFGVDAELLHLFGRTGMYRIKTDPAQTDLFLLTKVPAFREPGFTQTFTLFAEKIQQGGGLAGTLAYQYRKHSEDILYPCTDAFNTTVINDAESLQEWTAHSFVLMLSYDWAYKTTWQHVPSCSLFGKIGFNGKRAVLANTVGFSFAIAF